MTETVYKYFNWNDNDSKKILTEFVLYFCNAKKWENYGEYNFKFKEIDKNILIESIRKETYRMRNEEFPNYEYWFNYHNNNYKIDLNSIEHLTPEEKCQWETQIVETIIYKRVEDILKNQDDYENSSKQFHFERTGIFSTSLSKNSNQLWEWKQDYQKVYNGNAVCVGLDLVKIKSKLDIIGNYTLGLINYEENINEVNFLSFSDNDLQERLNSITFTLNVNAVENIIEQNEFRIMKFLKYDTSLFSSERFLSMDSDLIK